MSLHTQLYHFILKYNIYTFVCKLNYVFKIRVATVKLILKLLSVSLYLPDITCKFVYWGLNEAFPITMSGRYTKSILGQIVLRFLTYSVYMYIHTYTGATRGL